MFAPTVILEVFAEDNSFKQTNSLFTGSKVAPACLVDKEFFLGCKTIRVHGFKDLFPLFKPGFICFFESSAIYFF